MRMQRLSCECPSAGAVTGSERSEGPTHTVSCLSGGHDFDSVCKGTVRVGHGSVLLSRENVID